MPRHLAHRHAVARRLTAIHLTGMSDRHDARILNGLIEIVIDSADGLDAAVEDAPAHADVFREIGAARRAAATALQGEVERLGRDPDDDGSLLARAHRVLMDLRDRAGGDAALLDEMLRGETALEGRFDAALADERLTGSARNAVIRAWDVLKPGRDRLIQLRDGL